ncbi:NAD(P)-binding protein, partial [Aureobasidium melanogenum]
MVSLDLVRKANSSPRPRLPKPVVLLPGRTSGIGRSTLRQLALNTNAPKAYIVGCSESNAKPSLQELHHMNPLGSFNFIEADVSLMRIADKACESIKQQEKALDLFFMTPEAAESQPGRVVSVLGGGFGGNINADDLDLKHNYNIVSCAMHSVTMTSPAMEHLAASNRASFVLAYPGLVGTNIYTNSFPPPLAAVYNYGMWPLMYPFSANINESGLRDLFHATSDHHPAKNFHGLKATAACGETEVFLVFTAVFTIVIIIIIATPTFIGFIVLFFDCCKLSVRCVDNYFSFCKFTVSISCIIGFFKLFGLIKIKLIIFKCAINFFILGVRFDHWTVRDQDRNAYC